MGVFAYSFIMMLLHSLWQAGLLYLPYLAMGKLLRNQHPLTRRNILFVLLVSQIVLSLFTFTYYYSGFEGAGTALLEVMAGDPLKQIPYAYTISNIFIIVYFLVILFRSAVQVRQWLSFRNYCNENLVRPSAEIRIFTEQTGNRFGINRRVSIWYHHNITGPLTYGILKPVILIPVALVNHLSTKEVESLIIHELSHIRYNDYALNFMVIFMETIFFFNPFVRSIVNGIRLEREKNCDLQVINFRYDPLQYAETLLKALKMKPAMTGLSIGAVHRKNHLLKRIKFFTSDPGNSGCRKYLAVAYMAVILFFGVNLFTINGIRSGRLLEATALTPGFSPRIMLGDGLESRQIHTSPVQERATFAAVQKPARAIEYLPDSKTLDGVIVTATPPEPMSMPVIPVSYEEQDIKEMVVTDTDPVTGNTVTTVFRVVTIDGELHTQPVLTIVEGTLKTDSLQLKADSIRKFNIEQ